MFTEEQQSQINALIDAAKAEQADELDRLRVHNANLIAEKREVRERNKTLEAEGAKLAEYETRIASLTEERDDMRRAHHATIAERDLSAAISEAGIMGPLVPAFTALMRAKGLSINVDTDTPFATIQGASVTDFVRSFTASDAGKHFVAALGNGGGGTLEPQTRISANARTLSEMTLKERTELHRSDPIAYKAAMGV